MLTFRKNYVTSTCHISCPKNGGCTRNSNVDQQYDYWSPITGSFRDHFLLSVSRQWRWVRIEQRLKGVIGIGAVIMTSIVVPGDAAVVATSLLPQWNGCGDCHSDQVASFLVKRRCKHHFNTILHWQKPVSATPTAQSAQMLQLR